MMTVSIIELREAVVAQQLAFDLTVVGLIPTWGNVLFSLTNKKGKKK